MSYQNKEEEGKGYNSHNKSLLKCWCPHKKHRQHSHKKLGKIGTYTSVTDVRKLIKPIERIRQVQPVQQVVIRKSITPQEESTTLPLGAQLDLKWSGW